MLQAQTFSCSDSLFLNEFNILQYILVIVPIRFLMVLQNEWSICIEKILQLIMIK